MNQPTNEPPVAPEPSKSELDNIQLTDFKMVIARAAGVLELVPMGEEAAKKLQKDLEAAVPDIPIAEYFWIEAGAEMLAAYARLSDGRCVIYYREGFARLLPKAEERKGK